MTRKLALTAALLAFFPALSFAQPRTLTVHDTPRTVHDRTPHIHDRAPHIRNVTPVARS